MLGHDANQDSIAVHLGLGVNQGFKGIVDMRSFILILKLLDTSLAY